MTFCCPVRAPVAFLMLALCGALVSGCGYSAQQLSLDEDKARESLNTALKAWQEGKKPADLKPGIIVGDEDWNAGLALTSFKVLPDETNDGTNLHIPVELALKAPAGVEQKSNVLYIVGTSPMVTIFRD